MGPLSARTRLWLLTVLVAGLGLLVASLAGASSSVAGPRAQRAGEALTPVERKALRIVSVRPVGVDPLGLVVTVTFAGNIERALGQGHLKHALVAMILEPRDTSRASAGLVTQGGGAVGKTLRKTRATEVGVSRSGSRIVFFIHGPGAAGVGRIRIKAFPTAPSGWSARFRTLASRTAEAPQLIPQEEWDALAHHITAQQRVVDFVAPRLDKLEDCDALKSVLAGVRLVIQLARQRNQRLHELARQLDRAIDLAEKRQTKKVPQQVYDVLDVLGKPYYWATGDSTLAQDFANLKALLTKLRADAALVKTLIARNDFLLASARSFESDLERAIAAECGPGQAPPPPGLRVFFESVGYDHTTPGNPPGQLPSTVCADFVTSPALNDGTWDAELTSAVAATRRAHGEILLLSGGRGRVVFGIPVAGSYHLKVTVDDGKGNTAVRETDIPVPAPPPSGKSKDCHPPPLPA